jgi:hypothetical protein
MTPPLWPEPTASHKPGTHWRPRRRGSFPEKVAQLLALADRTGADPHQHRPRPPLHGWAESAEQIRRIEIDVGKQAWSKGRCRKACTRRPVPLQMRLTSDLEMLQAPANPSIKASTLRVRSPVKATTYTASRTLSTNHRGGSSQWK